MRVLVLLLLGLGVNAFGQTPRVEVTGRIGAASLRVFGSEYSKSAVNLGIGIEHRIHPHLGLGFEFDRLLNLKPVPTPCGLNVPCIGSGVEGARSAYKISGNLYYYLTTEGPLQPYFVGGFGALHSVSARAVTFAGPTEARIAQQQEEKDTGVALGIGGGVRVPLGRRFSLRPEVRWYDSSIRSRSNFGVIQVGVIVGYHF